MIRSLKKIPAALLLAALIAVPGRAVPPTQQSVDQFLEVAKIKNSFDLMTANLDQTIRSKVVQSMPGVKFTTNDQKVLDEFRAKMTAVISEELNWAKIKRVYEQVYGTAFTQAEIDSLIAFYQSPVGQMFADKQPQITQKTAALMQEQMIPVIMKLRSAVNDAVDQIQAAHTAADQAPPPASSPDVTPAPSKP